MDLTPRDQTGGQATTGWSTVLRNGTACAVPLRLTIGKAAQRRGLFSASGKRATKPDAIFFIAH